MKRGTLNFLGRKNQSLFDTSVKMKEMDNVELVLESSAIPESGTASVRARPTVKHHASSSESFQGFAVPTPKVPLLPPSNGSKINGSIGGDHLSNGSVISVPDLVEGEILVPPPPTMSPPPPPATFIPPPPDFMGDLNTLGIQPPSMPAPKPTSVALSTGEEDFTFLQPPPMAPPKPPSTCSSGSASSVPISSPPPVNVPERPKFAPPQPPNERLQKTSKMPPPKPIRLSSIPNLDSPPQTPAPPPPVQTPTLSTFNPQNTAKLYSVPTTSILRYEERDTRPKQMLLLEDSGSVKSTPVFVQVDGKTPKVATPTKPVSKDVQEPKENSVITQPHQVPPPSQVPPPPQVPPPEPNKEVKIGTVSAPPEIEKPPRIAHQASPQLPKLNKTEKTMNSEPSKDKPEGSPSQSRRFSPLLDRKLRNLKSDTNHREGPVASPLALLMAAKEREKHRPTHSLSQEKNQQPNASIHPSDSNPNSFVVTPKSSVSSSLTSQDRIQESPKSVSPVAQTVQTPEKSSSPALVKDQITSSSPAFSTTATSRSVTNPVEQKRNAEQSPSEPEENKEEINIPLLPPPPEFDDFDDVVGPPPSMPPPDPPMKKAPTPTMCPPPPPPAHIPPPPPKPKPLAAPKLPPPDTDVKPKMQVQTKAPVAPSQLPANLSPSQATLLSILQKKMLEMDHKMAPVKETESSSDDWGSPLSDEENKIPVLPKATPQSKNYPVVANKATTLDMRELEGKVAKKYQETSSVKLPTSNGVQSKHQYGMTFTVRPGTKNPITLVSKGEP